MCVFVTAGDGGKHDSKNRKKKTVGCNQEDETKSGAALVDRNSFYSQFSSSDVTSPMSPNGAVHV
jgi:hypothetical protein